MIRLGVAFVFWITGSIIMLSIGSPTWLHLLGLLTAATILFAALRLMAGVPDDRYERDEHRFL